MKRRNQIAVSLLSMLVLANIVNILVLLFSAWNRDSVEPLELALPQNILVLAAHQDDGVIMAGGLLLQNINGDNTLVYLTRPDVEAIAKKRYHDARSIWRQYSGDKLELVFLDYQAESLVARQREIEVAIDKLIDHYSPNLVIAPLGEGGQAEHDFLSQVAARVMSERPATRLLYAAEYNPYIHALDFPEKLLWFMTRLMPFVSYLDPNYGLNPDAQLVLPMDGAQLDVKKAMLQGFSTEQGVIPLHQFGYPDLFETKSQTPDSGVWLAGKQLDSWALASLLLMFSLLTTAGFVVAQYSSRWWSRLLALSSFSMLAILIYWGRNALKEDGILLAFFLMGYFLATASSIIRGQFLEKSVESNE